MILVTGGTGLVGAHLLYQLVLNEPAVRAIYRTKDKLKLVKQVFSYYTTDVDTLFSKIEWVCADITAIPSLETAFLDVKKVYHCAALVSFNPKDYDTMLKVNIEGTANIVNFCIDYRIEKLCFVSSIATLGNTIHSKPITEETHWNDADDNNDYAISKFGAEMEVWRGSQEGLHVVIVNPGVILGSGFWETSSSNLIKKIHDGFNFYTNGVTGFVDVKDVVKCMILLMKNENLNQRYILVSENLSFKELFFRIADSFAIKRPSINVKKWQTSLFWKFEWIRNKITGKKPLLTRHTAISAHSISNYSSKKIKESLGIEFKPIKDTVADICKDYQKSTIDFD